MIILTIRTDKPEAEIGLFDGHTQRAYQTWEAHRQLATTIHQRIAALLQPASREKIEGIVCYEGPGSFTGLRIGLSVGNALAYGLNVPIMAIGGEAWIRLGIEKLQNGDTDQLALPKYGSLAHITVARK